MLLKFTPNSLFWWVILIPIYMNIFINIDRFILSCNSKGFPFQRTCPIVVCFGYPVDHWHSTIGHWMWVSKVIEMKWNADGSPQYFCVTCFCFSFCFEEHDAPFLVLPTNDKPHCLPYCINPFPHFKFNSRWKLEHH